MDDEYQVRDKRANDRFFIDNLFLRGGWGKKLGPFAIAVYNAIALHADNETQTAWPSAKRIADLTGMSPRQVARELQGLEKYRIIHIQSRANERKSSIISLLDKSEWLAPDTVFDEPGEHKPGEHMPEEHVPDSREASDSESDEHMPGSHTNNTHAPNNTHSNKTKGILPKGGGTKTPPPLAVKVYRSTAKRYPDESLWDGIARVVGEDQTNLDFWREVVVNYIACGWNKLNVKGMLQWYQRREIPTTEHGKNSKQGSTLEVPNSLPLPPLPPPSELETFWTRALAELRGSMTGAAYNQYLSGTQAVQRDNGRLVIAAPSAPVLDWLDQRGRKLIEPLLAGRGISQVEFVRAA